MTNRMFVTLFCGALAAAPAGAQPLLPGPAGFAPTAIGRIGPWPGQSPVGVVAVNAGPRGLDADDRADELYEAGRDAIEEGRFDRAVERFTRLIAMKSNRTDAALYWKA